MFLPEQPDLNWRNPKVVEAMHDVIRFWLDRGADGQRLLVAINFGERRQEVDISGLASDVSTLLSTHFSTHEGSAVTLQPHEGVLLRIQ